MGGVVNFGVPTAAEVPAGIATVDPPPMPSSADAAEEPSFVGDHYGAPTAVFGKASGKRIPRWILTLFGYITSAVLGLAIGYALLNWLRPDLLPAWMKSGRPPASKSGALPAPPPTAALPGTMDNHRH
jgi:hypothetical protein